MNASLCGAHARWSSLRLSHRAKRRWRDPRRPGHGGRRRTSGRGDLESHERESILEAFRRGSKTVIAAPRVLDEGIDVPEADLGIVVSASRSRRQMIQRMGRLLRLIGDGAVARLVIIYAQNTSEDPAQGAHHSLIDLAWNVAPDMAVFSDTQCSEDMALFLSQPHQVISS